ncbi:hypothetical protein [Zavarzinella formosa]|uniref:hypothetical protein n=1 Tax=Zavarzinella formosa TaxID=360055 RepID=UPI0002ED276F|nr:hypothetical protein [Zavarzinella formosa]
MKGPESALIETTEVHHIIRGLAVGSFGMSFFSFLVFWWIPFGFLVSSAAGVMALTSIALGIRTKERGLYYPLGAIALTIITTHAALLSMKFTNVLFLDF